MSLSKLPKTTVVAAQAATAFQPFSISCPAPAPGPTPSPAPSSSGGLSGCTWVPYYGIVITTVQTAGYAQTQEFSYGIIGYYEVCP